MRVQYVIPPNINNNPIAKAIFESTIKEIKKSCAKLENEYDVKKEDSAMLLPLGMTTKVVEKRNLRNLITMSRVRECNRAYYEFRELFGDIKNALSEYSDEWKELCKIVFMPKCEELDYCTENNSCGRKPKKY